MDYHFSKGTIEKQFFSQNNLLKICINDDEYNLKLKTGKWKSLYKKNNNNDIVGFVFYNALCSNYDNALLFKKNLTKEVNDSKLSLFIDESSIFEKDIPFQLIQCYFYYDKQNNLIAIEIN